MEMSFAGAKGGSSRSEIVDCLELRNKTEKMEIDEMMIDMWLVRSLCLRVVVSDGVQRRFYNLVDRVMQSRDNHNPVTCPLNRMAL